MARRGFEVRVALVCRADGRVFDPNRDRARYGFLIWYTMYSFWQFKFSGNKKGGK